MLGLLLLGCGPEAERTRVTLLGTTDVLRENWRLEPEEAARRLIETGATLPRF